MYLGDIEKVWDVGDAPIEEPLLMPETANPELAPVEALIETAVHGGSDGGAHE
jgi:hypothetical protein